MITQDELEVAGKKECQRLMVYHTARIKEDIERLRDKHNKKDMRRVLKNDMRRSQMIVKEMLYLFSTPGASFAVYGYRKGRNFNV